jgi:hypothetical protein
MTPSGGNKVAVVPPIPLNNPRTPVQINSWAAILE